MGGEAKRMPLHSQIGTGTKRRTIASAIVLIVLIVAMECVVFNARWLIALVPMETVSIDSVSATGAELSTDGTTLTSSANSPSLRIELTEPTNVETISVALADTGAESLLQALGFNAGNVYEVVLIGVLANGSGSVVLAEQTLMSNISSTESVFVASNEELKAISVVFKGVSSGETVRLDGVIQCNTAVPFNVSAPRLVVEILLALFIFAVRPKSRLRQIELSSPSRLGYAVIAVCVMVTVGFSVAVSISTHVYDYASEEPDGYIHDSSQYQHMADALLKGQAYLDIDPPQWLKDADNPYDYEYRRDMGLSTGERALFDYAYYDGHYYSYFGVLPAIALFAPYKALTGVDLSTIKATAILVVFAAVGIWSLVWSFMRWRFKFASVADFLLLGMFSFVASGVLYLAFYPSVYHIAILTGFILAVFGVVCWIKAEIGEVPKRRFLILGSCLVALTLLARPTVVLTLFLAFPIFWRHIRKDRKGQRRFFSLRNGAFSNTVCVILPFLIIGCFAMAWNWVRFGSPLDFGSNYNLTAFDMTAKQVEITALLYSLFMYLLAPIQVSSDFPFMTYYTLSTPLFGSIQEATDLVIEPYYAGLFTGLPVTLTLFAVFSHKIRRQLKNGKTLGLVIASVVLGLMIAVIDSSVAVTQRYQSDFQWLFALATIVVCLSLKKTLLDTGRNGIFYVVLQLIFIIAVIFSVVFMLMNLFAIERYESYIDSNPQVWWTVASWFMGL